MLPGPWARRKGSARPDEADDVLDGAHGLASDRGGALGAVGEDPVDMAGIARQVIDAIDLPGILRQSTGAVSSQAARVVRTEGMHADESVARFVDRLLRRPHTQGA